MIKFTRGPSGCSFSKDHEAEDPLQPLRNIGAREDVSSTVNRWPTVYAFKDFLEGLLWLHGDLYNMGQVRVAMMSLLACPHHGMEPRDHGFTSTETPG